MSGRGAVVLRPNGAPRPALKSVVDKRIKEGMDAEEILLKLGGGSDGWMSGAGESKEGISVFFRDGSRDRSPSDRPSGTLLLEPETENEKESPKSYKIWKCQGEVNAPAADIFRLMSDTSQMPKWNKDVTDYHILETIDSQTDVAQCVSGSSASGTVSPRDFVIIRRRSQKDANTFLIADTGTKHPKATNFTGGSIVRGWNGPGGIIIKRISAEKSWVCWVLNKDLGGWIPRSLVDQVIAGVLVDWLKNLRKALPPPPPSIVPQKQPTKTTTPPSLSGPSLPQKQPIKATMPNSHTQPKRVFPTPTPIPCPN